MKTRSTTDTSDRLTLRQLSHLSAPAALLLPPMINCLRSLTKADHAAFFYCDDQGLITNLYAERMLSPEQMAKYYDKHYQSGTSAFREAYLQRVQSSDPISIRSVSEQERQTEYYKEVLSPLKIEHFAYAIISNAGRPIGQLSLYRGKKGAPFDSSNVSDLRNVLQYLGAAFDSNRNSRTGANSLQYAEESVAVLQVDGKILFSDTNWLRLIRMAQGDSISPASAKKAARDTKEFTASILKTLLIAKKASHRIDSPWGQFLFRAHSMQSESEEKAATLIVSRLSNESIFAAEAAAKLNLPVQQREVAVLLVEGKSNSEIARALGISINTANYHVKALFQRLEIHERSEVILAMRTAIDTSLNQ